MRGCEAARLAVLFAARKASPRHGCDLKTGACARTEDARGCSRPAGPAGRGAEPGLSRGRWSTGAEGGGCLAQVGTGRRSGIEQRHGRQRGVEGGEDEGWGEMSWLRRLRRLRRSGRLPAWLRTACSACSRPRTRPPFARSCFITASEYRRLRAREAYPLRGPRNGNPSGMRYMGSVRDRSVLHAGGIAISRASRFSVADERQRGNLVHPPPRTRPSALAGITFRPTRRAVGPIN